MSAVATPSRDARLAAIQASLAALYGAAPEAARLFDWISTRPAAEALAPTAIDHATQVLVAYPDHVSDAVRAPLDVLGELLASELAGAFSHVHVLPFFPADGDEGYAVIDHLAVHPRLGSWAQLRAALGGRGWVCDLVANHVSTQHPLFRDLLARGESRHFVHRGDFAEQGWGHRVRDTAIYQPFDTAAGTRWVWCTYGRTQADLDYASPAALAYLLEVLDGLLRRGAGVIRLDALPHLWKGPGVAGPHHPNVVELLRVARAFTDLVQPGALLFAETDARPGGAYFGPDRAAFGNALAVPLLLLGCAAGDPAPLARWLGERGRPDPSVRPFTFLNTHDGMHLLPMSCPLPEGTAAPLFEQLAVHGVRITDTVSGGAARPYEINSPLATVLHGLARGDADRAAALELALHGLLFALPGIPMIYLPNLFGLPAEPGAAVEPGNARALNRRRFAWRELRAHLAGPGRARFVALRELSRLRARTPAFDPGAPTAVREAPPGAIWFARGEARPVQVIANFGDAAISAALGAAHVDLLEPAAPARASWTIEPTRVRWLAPV